MFLVYLPNEQICLEILKQEHKYKNEILMILIKSVYFTFYFNMQKIEMCFYFLYYKNMFKVYKENWLYMFYSIKRFQPYKMCMYKKIFFTCNKDIFIYKKTKRSWFFILCLLKNVNYLIWLFWKFMIKKHNEYIYADTHWWWRIHCIH